jgi:hypothetical protein
MRDCSSKGRTARGDKSGMAKLTTKEVIDIKSLFGSMPQAKIARMFGVHVMTINDIFKGRSWVHI